jgi:hypothetical protein
VSDEWRKIQFDAAAYGAAYSIVSASGITHQPRPDGLVTRPDTTTPCRCGQAGCQWTEADDIQRDRIEQAEREGPELFPEMYPKRQS